MKKWFALLGTAGLSVASFAQSSVTISGLVDTSVSYGSGSTASMTKMSSSKTSVSNIAFRGTEDIGGGIWAGFWLEAGLNPDGTGQATNTNNQANGNSVGNGLTFNRRSTVSLGNNAIGELRLGRDLLPQYWNLYYGDVFGSLGVGAAVNYTNIITGAVSTRASNQFAYVSPALGGFRVHAAYYRGGNLSTAANPDDGNGAGVRLSYSNGPFNAGVAVSNTTYLAGDVKQNSLHADYRFGAVKVVAGLSSDRNGTVKANGASLGAIAYLDGASEVRVGYSRYVTDAAGDPGVSKLGVGYTYFLSKRTSVYAMYAHLTNKGGSASALNGAVTGANASSNGMDVGIRHTF